MKCSLCPIKTEEGCEGEAHPDVICRGVEEGIPEYIALAKPVGLAPPISPPSLGQQAKSFSKSVYDFISAGAPVASSEVVAQRLAICQGCDYHGPDPIFNSVEGRCLKCGCLLKAKIRMATESCPIARWGPISPIESEPSPKMEDNQVQSVVVHDCGCNHR